MPQAGHRDLPTPASCRFRGFIIGHPSNPANRSRFRASRRCCCGTCLQPARLPRRSPSRRDGARPSRRGGGPRLVARIPARTVSASPSKAGRVTSGPLGDFSLQALARRSAIRDVRPLRSVGRQVAPKDPRSVIGRLRCRLVRREDQGPPVRHPHGDDQPADGVLDDAQGDSARVRPCRREPGRTIRG